MSRKEKLEEEISHRAASFVNEESNHTSLITVTHTTLSTSLTEATIYFTVLPRDKEEDVLHFLRRRRTDFRKELKEKLSSRRIPTVDFVIDEGEKHRQDIDAILRKT